MTPRLWTGTTSAVEGAILSVQAGFIQFKPRYVLMFALAEREPEWPEDALAQPAT